MQAQNQPSVQPNKQLTLEPNSRQKPNLRPIDPHSCTALLTLEKQNPCTLANPRTPLDRTEPVYPIRTNTYPNFNQYIVTTKVGFLNFFSSICWMRICSFEFWVLSFVLNLMVNCCWLICISIWSLKMWLLVRVLMRFFMGLWSLWKIGRCSLKFFSWIGRGRDEWKWRA